MIDFLQRTFASIFGDNVALATILISVVPLIELRGAIPFGTSTKLWGDLALNNWASLGYSLIGSSLIVPILALIYLPIINWLKKFKAFKRTANWLEQRVQNQANNISQEATVAVKFSKAWWKKVFAIVIFVAVPLPLTGVWTGTCVAIFMGLDFPTTTISVIFGNICAGLIVTLILEFFPFLNDWLFFIFLGIIIIAILAEWVKGKIKNKKA